MVGRARAHSSRCDWHNAVLDLGPDGAVVTETFGVSYHDLADRLDVPLRPRPRRRNVGDVSASRWTNGGHWDRQVRCPSGGPSLAAGRHLPHGWRALRDDSGLPGFNPLGREDGRMR